MRAVAFVMWGGIAQQLEAPIVAMKAPGAKIVKAGHPQMAAGYFKGGRSLTLQDRSWNERLSSRNDRTTSK